MGWRRAKGGTSLCPFALCLSRRTHVLYHLLGRSRRKSVPEQRLLGPVASQRERPQLGCLGLLTLAKFKQEFSTDGVEEVIPVEIACKGLDLSQRCFWPGHVAQRDCSVQSHDWRGRHLKQEIVEGQDLRPVRSLPRSRLGMAGYQRSLHLVGARTSQHCSLLDHRHGFRNHVSIPARAVLMGEQD